MHCPMSGHKHRFRYQNSLPELCVLASWPLSRDVCPAAKSDRLKQAKAEADKEIQAYKQDKENSFQQKVSAVRDA